MSEARTGLLRDWEATSEEIRQVMAQAIRRTLREHKRAGRSVIFWDRERDAIVEVPADSIPVPDDHDQV